jgi:ankyrin repeat protein
MGGAATSKPQGNLKIVHKKTEWSSEQFRPPTAKRFNASEDESSVEEFLKACMLGDLPKVKQYIEEKHIDINKVVDRIEYIPLTPRISKNPEQQEIYLESASAIHVATLSGHDDIVEYLISKNVNLDVPGNYVIKDPPVKQWLLDSTPLHLSLFSCYPDITDSLLEAGADPHKKMNFEYENSDHDRFNEQHSGITALHCAALWSDEDTCGMLIEMDDSLCDELSNEGRRYTEMSDHATAQDQSWEKQEEEL